MTNVCAQISSRARLALAACLLVLTAPALAQQQTTYYWRLQQPTAGTAQALTGVSTTYTALTASTASTIAAGTMGANSCLRFRWAVTFAGSTTKNLKIGIDSTQLGTRLFAATAGTYVGSDIVCNQNSTSAQAQLNDAVYLSGGSLQAGPSLNFASFLTATNSFTPQIQIACQSATCVSGDTAKLEMWEVELIP